MSKLKKSIFFTDFGQNKRFLFKLIRYQNKENKEDLKFVFSHPNQEGLRVYGKDIREFQDDNFILDYDELSYHTDGSLLWKLTPAKDEIEKKFYENPYGYQVRRTPLDKISEWEPVVLGNIFQYDQCYPEITDDAEILPSNDLIFNGDPFEYRIFLGHNVYNSPPNHKYKDEIIYRVPNVTNRLDLIVWIIKSDFRGFKYKWGEIDVHLDSNIVRVCLPNLNVVEGATEIDLLSLKKPAWNPEFVNENFKANIDVLRSLPPKTLLAKAYLSYNPHLDILKKWVGFNKGFLVSPKMNNICVNHELCGILNKDENGDFLVLLTPPNEPPDLKP